MNQWRGGLWSLARVFMMGRFPALLMSLTPWGSWGKGGNISINQKQEGGEVSSSKLGGEWGRWRPGRLRSESGSQGNQGGGDRGYERLRSCISQGQAQHRRGASGATSGSGPLAFSSRSLLATCCCCCSSSIFTLSLSLSLSLRWRQLWNLLRNGKEGDQIGNCSEITCWEIWRVGLGDSCLTHSPSWRDNFARELATS